MAKSRKKRAKVGFLGSGFGLGTIAGAAAVAFGLYKLVTAKKNEEAGNELVAIPTEENVPISETATKGLPIDAQKNIPVGVAVVSTDKTGEKTLSANTGLQILTVKMPADVNASALTAKVSGILIVEKKDVSKYWNKPASVGYLGWNPAPQVSGYDSCKSVLI